MRVIGAEILALVATTRHFELKMVFNRRGAIVFEVSSQHREMKFEGISYEDNYRGNALAAMLRPGQIEVRFHQDFSDRAVAEILTELLADSAFAALGPLAATYQGRTLTIPPAR